MPGQKMPLKKQLVLPVLSGEDSPLFLETRTPVPAIQALKSS
jgi:hypothetical protein